MSEAPRRNIKAMKGLAETQQRRRDQAMERQKTARRDLAVHARRLAIPDDPSSQGQSTTVRTMACAEHTIACGVIIPRIVLRWHFPDPTGGFSATSFCK
jgi:hypothetical protein